MYKPAPPDTSRAVTVCRGFGCSARHRAKAEVESEAVNMPIPDGNITTDCGELFRLGERVRPFVRNDACRELTFLSSREADCSGVPYSA